ncbi:uncharacterized protein LOC126811538 [Patella vulgata]|uniref:uncharacterized protein LOC126811538 n=1 Tax=Patella vulgata TaxID=6465 RepID=UPI00217FCE28|nr:uncharacterized protein LOC126811538 [Patella vulgata]
MNPEQTYLAIWVTQCYVVDIALTEEIYGLIHLVFVPDERMSSLDESICTILLHIGFESCKVVGELLKTKKNIEDTEKYGPHPSDELPEHWCDCTRLEDLVSEIKVAMGRIFNYFKELHEYGVCGLKDESYTHIPNTVSSVRNQCLHEKTRLALRGLLADSNTIISWLSGAVEGQRMARRHGQNNTAVQSPGTTPLQKICDIITDVTEHLDKIRDTFRLLWGAQVREVKEQKPRSDVDSGLASSDDKCLFEATIQHTTECLQALCASNEYIADGTTEASLHINDFEACNRSGQYSQSRRQSGPIENEEH